MTSPAATPAAPLKRTPFYDFHVSQGGRMVEFAGWEMPIVYRSIIEEHEHTRRSGSIFDVSHMGRMSFTGKDAAAFLDRVLTRNVQQMKVGQCRYSLVCNEAGGSMDDVIVSRDQKNWLLVCNASNREKLNRHFHQVRQSTGLDFDMVDNTEGTAMVAVQGPKVIDRIGNVLPVDVKSMKRYTPLLSVTAVRTFSMSAGLATSTVTPGNTPPDESRTVPAMAPVPKVCASTSEGSIRIASVVTRVVAKEFRIIRFISRPSP